MFFSLDVPDIVQEHLVLMHGLSVALSANLFLNLMFVKK